MTNVTVPLADEDTGNGVAALYALLAAKSDESDRSIYARKGAHTVLGVALGVTAPEDALDLYRESIGYALEGDVTASAFAAHVGTVQGAGFMEGFNEARALLPSHMQAWLAAV